MLFDEPTSALDPELVGSVLAVMRDLRRAGMTMVVVCTRCASRARRRTASSSWRHGRIVEEGPPERIFSAPENARTRAFVAEITR